MNIDFIAEPELEFGNGHHVDIRFGITNFSTVDHDHPRAPKRIKIGFIGTNETIEGITKWLEKCQNEIPAKRSNQPNLFPMFPGFNLDTGFKSMVLLHEDFYRAIPEKKIKDFEGEKNRNKRVEKIAELFVQEMKYLKDKLNIDLFVCAIPEIVLELTYSTVTSSRKFGDKRQLNFDLHDLLKAKSLELDIPIQLVLPSTYDKTKLRPLKTITATKRRLQDEATRAWNFHTALYYKAKGVPWRLKRSFSDIATCYMGVSFYKSLDEETLRTSVAQVFNERGEGIIVRGGFAKYDKRDRQVHLSGKAAHDLVTNTLEQYKREHGHYPARLVLHKSSSNSSDEIAGFKSGAKACQVESIDLVSLNKSFIRLFRTQQYPPLRGTFLSLESNKHLLYTKGSVNFFTTYPGLYVPRTLLINSANSESTGKTLAQEILALTKMNWNNTQFDGGDPITLRAARQVGKILRYTRKEDTISSYYRFYM